MKYRGSIHRLNQNSSMAQYDSDSSSGEEDNSPETNVLLGVPQPQHRQRQHRQQSHTSSLPPFLQNSPYLPVWSGSDEPSTQAAKPTNHVNPTINQLLRSRRVRVISAVILAFVIGAFFFVPRSGLDLAILHRPAPYCTTPSPPRPPLEPPASCADKDIDWSRYAYVQYVTSTAYLCNSVMLFEILHRLGSKADRLMMYPSNFNPDPEEDSVESRLLLKAKNEYGVKLMPVQVQHKKGDPEWADSYTKLLAFNQTQYERVLSLDSDSTILQPMDELFLLPATPVAMPRAYWLNDKPGTILSSYVFLIQPSVQEFERIEYAIKTAKTGAYDMEIVNDLYGKSCMVLPHRRYGLLTGEFRANEHLDYMGNGYEAWDPEAVFKEAKFLHFSDWPFPKPWLSYSKSEFEWAKPKCVRDSEGNEDCRARDLWAGFYNDFNERRENICSFGTHKSTVKPNKRSWEYEPKV